MPASDARRRFILVTGMPRSGTTGVGSALALAPGAASLYEPLNPLSGLRGVEGYFQFAGPDGPSPDLERDLRRVLRVSVRTRAGIWASDPWPRRVVKRVTGSRSRVSALRCRLDPRVRTVVWKDPFASFLLPVVVEDLGLPVLVTVRSPQAAAASFKRLGWGFDLERVRSHVARLHPDADYLPTGADWTLAAATPVGNAAHLWSMLYGYLDHASRSLDHDGAQWVNVSRLLADPVATYRDLFTRLDLPFDDSVRSGIESEYRDEGAATPSSARAHDSRRNVQTSGSYWTDLLSAEEQQLVEEATALVRGRVESRIGALG